MPKVDLPTDPRFINLTDQKFGRFTVVEYVGKKFSQHHWLCRCECGNTKVVYGGHLKSGASRSCGCLRVDVNTALRTVHGMALSSTHSTWGSMLSRCSNSNEPGYANYGGRGISVCDRWRDFRNFLADMGDRPRGTTIDRIDVNGNYEPENCRWASRTQQARNTRSNRRLTFKGESLTVTEWAERLGVNARTLYSRAHYGWSDERILTTPIRPY